VGLTLFVERIESLGVLTNNQRSAGGGLTSADGDVSMIGLRGAVVGCFAEASESFATGGAEEPIV
jgi:hypothetical protein